MNIIEDIAEVDWQPEDGISGQLILLSSSITVLCIQLVQLDSGKQESEVVNDARQSFSELANPHAYAHLHLPKDGSETFLTSTGKKGKLELVHLASLLTI